METKTKVMIQSRYASILWILYGFVLLTAIFSVLEAAVYTYMHYGLVNGYMIRRFSYYIPCFAFIVYGITAVLLVLAANRKSKRHKPLTLPKLSLIICIIVAISFQYYTERISDWHLTVLFDDLSKAEYMSSVSFGKLFAIVEHTTLILRWAFIIFAIIFFSFKLKTSVENE